MTTIKGQPVPSKEVAKIVKGTLILRWGSENVSVQIGTGNKGRDWIHADVAVVAPKDCTCQRAGACDACRRKVEATVTEAERYSYRALELHEAEFSVYYDEADQPRDCFTAAARIRPGAAASDL